MSRQLRAVPISRALTRPNLMLGCDRTLLILLVGVSTALGIFGGVMQARGTLVVIAASLFYFGKGGLQAMAKADPQLREVYGRATRYARTYDARPRWDRAEPPRGRWS